MEKLAFTAAELTFLLSSADPDRQERARARLGLTDEQRGEAIARAGLSSLAARGLVEGAGPELRIAPDVATTLHGLVETVLWMEVAALTRDAVDVAQLYVHDRGMFLLSPRRYATFEVQGVRSGVSPVELLVSVARRSLGAAPALVACRGDATGGAIAVAARADGTWLFSNELTGVQQASSTVEDALRAFAAALAEFSPAMSAA